MKIKFLLLSAFSSAVCLVVAGHVSALTPEQSGWCHDFNSNIYFGANANEVRALHTALQKEGILYGSDTADIYGENTAGAVVAFQTKYNIKKSGYVGDSTRAKLNALYGCTNTGTDTNTDTDIGTLPNPTTLCTPYWAECTDWSACVNGQKSQTCTDLWQCGTTPDNKKIFTMNCCVPDWQCSNWSACPAGIQVRTCKDANNCGANYAYTKPAISQSCTPCVPNWKMADDWTECINGWRTRGSMDLHKCNSSYGLPETVDACTPKKSCVSNWQCSEWGKCQQDGKQTRKCTDFCMDIDKMPQIVKSCTCVPNWQCSEWSGCYNGQQTRTCKDTNDCGTTLNRPARTQSCTGSCEPVWKANVTTNAPSGQRVPYIDTNKCGVLVNRPFETGGNAYNSCGVVCDKVGTCVNGQQNWSCHLKQYPAYGCSYTPRTVTTTCPLFSNCIPECGAGSCGVPDGCGGFCDDSIGDLIIGCPSGQRCMSGVCANLSYNCAENWQCSPWSECINSEQTRKCADFNACPVQFVKPKEKQPCTVPPSAVDIKVNGSDGPMNFALGSTITLSWISDGATRCGIGGSWNEGAIVSSNIAKDNLSGSVVIKLPSERTLNDWYKRPMVYSISCYKSSYVTAESAHVTDNVVVNMIDPPSSSSLTSGSSGTGATVGALKLCKVSTSNSIAYIDNGCSAWCKSKSSTYLGACSSLGCSCCYTIPGGAYCPIRNN